MQYLQCQNRYSTLFLFSNITLLQDTQTELVLLVLLRLVEDVVTFQNLQTSRRRDVLQALTSHMAELFTFMVQLLTHHVETYRQLVSTLVSVYRRYGILEKKHVTA